MSTAQKPPAISGEAFAGNCAAHSPGPWTVDPVTFWRRDAKGREIFRPYGISVADAKLVDAAPDLLKALQAVVDGWDNWADKGRIEVAIHGARKAIAKAGI